MFATGATATAPSLRSGNRLVAIAVETFPLQAFKENDMELTIELPIVTPVSAVILVARPIHIALEADLALPDTAQAPDALSPTVPELKRPCLFRSYVQLLLLHNERQLLVARQYRLRNVTELTASMLSFLARKQQLQPEQGPCAWAVTELPLYAIGFIVQNRRPLPMTYRGILIRLLAVRRQLLRSLLGRNVLLQLQTPMSPRLPNFVVSVMEDASLATFASSI